LKKEEDDRLKMPKESTKGGLGSRVGYGMLIALCRVVGALPAWFLYRCLSPALYFLLYKVVGYRKKVVRGNLALVFPDKTAEERRRIERSFYRHLSEVMIDMVDLMSITPQQVRRRLVIENRAEHDARTAGRGWIAALAHYGSWELFAAYPLYTDAPTASAYRPLHNRAMERLMLRSRSRFGMRLVRMQDLARFLASHRTDGYALGMIIDQSPQVRSSNVWLEFLGRPTRFFTSMERFAVKYGLQVYFFHLRKTARGQYSGWFEMIYDGVEEIAEGEVTLRYARRLEQQIRERPQLWMWSHRRWKHAVPDEVRERLANGEQTVMPM